MIAFPSKQVNRSWLLKKTTMTNNNKSLKMYSTIEPQPVPRLITKDHEIPEIGPQGLTYDYIVEFTPLLERYAAYHPYFPTKLGAWHILQKGAEIREKRYSKMKKEIDQEREELWG
jgi:hypothetical protein